MLQERNVLGGPAVNSLEGQRKGRQIRGLAQDSSHCPLPPLVANLLGPLEFRRYLPGGTGGAAGRGGGGREGEGKDMGVLSRGRMQEKPGFLTSN